MKVLGDIAKVIDCEHRTAPKTEEVPYGFSVGTSAVRHGRIDLARAKPISKETYVSWTRRATPGVGDLIFSREAPMGEVGMVPGDVRVCLGQRTVLMRLDHQKVDHRFLLYALMSPHSQTWIKENSAGSTVLHLNVADVRRIPIHYLPSLDDQRRIVEILEDHLSRLDAAARGLRVGLRRCESLLTSGLWQSTHGLAGAARVELQSIAEVRLGRQRSPKNHSGNRMRPYLRAANVDWGRLRLDDIKEMQFTEAEEETYRLRNGDILLTEASGSPAEVGKSVTYRGIPADVCFQNTLLRVRCHSANPDFVQAYLLAEARAGRFMPASRGVGINHLGRARLATLPLELPPADVQQAAVARCRELNEEVSRLKVTLENQADRTSTLRRSLLATAFSGRLNGAESDLSAAEDMIGA
ncbi:restriction endonuclease subunit S [Nocardioides panacisoli]|uniref:Type I restriction modification DNA specificity domain-containing protein n=1 Tax=Nocardioides panacisoli TaxID=627624 RepID=A0ABP7HXQ8_9ACTN